MKRTGRFLLLLFVAGAAYAEPQYVSDKLVISVYVEANQESEKLTTLDSGDAVDAIEKSEGYTRVKLADGREGWIKSSYLVSQAPAIVRVKELEKERGQTAATQTASLQEEVKQLKAQNAALNGEVDKLNRASAEVSAARPHPEEPQSRSEHATIVLESAGGAGDSMIDSSYAHIALWAGALVLTGGVLGYLLGRRSIASRIARKYGKLKIY